MAHRGSTRRVKSTEDYLGAVRRMLKAAARRVAEGDEFELAGILRLQADLDWAVGQAVAGQRQLGDKSWSQIAEGASCTRQAAHERWSKVPYELQ